MLLIKKPITAYNEYYVIYKPVITTESQQSQHNNINIIQCGNLIFIIVPAAHACKSILLSIASWCVLSIGEGSVAEFIIM